MLPIRSQNAVVYHVVSALLHFTSMVQWNKAPNIPRIKRRHGTAEFFLYNFFSHMFISSWITYPQKAANIQRHSEIVNFPYVLQQDQLTVKWNYYHHECIIDGGGTWRIIETINSMNVCSNSVLLWKNKLSSSY